MTCQGFGEMLQYQCGVVVWKDDQIQRTRVRSSNPIILYLTMLGIAVLNACFPRCIGVESDKVAFFDKFEKSYGFFCPCQVILGLLTSKQSFNVSIVKRRR